MICSRLCPGRKCSTWNNFGQLRINTGVRSRECSTWNKIDGGFVEGKSELPGHTALVDENVPRGTFGSDVCFMDFGTIKNVRGTGFGRGAPITDKEGSAAPPAG